MRRLAFFLPKGFFAALLLGAGLVIGVPQGQPASAQTNAPQTATRSAEDYFDAAAQAYIGGQTARAEAEAEAGLRAYPADSKLQALLETLKKQRQQQNGGGSASQGQPQDNNQNDPDRTDDSQARQGSPDSQNDEDSQQPESQPPNDPNENGEQPSDPQQAEGEQTAPGSQQPDPDRLTEQQALRILQAMQNQEKQLLRQVQRRGTRSRSVEKDW